MALIQMCEHDKWVTVHVIRDTDEVADVLSFFGLTFADWIANRWRLEVRPTEEVRTMEICELHTEGLHA